MADTYNIGPVVPGLFRAHEARYQEVLKEVERLQAELDALRALLTEVCPVGVQKVSADLDARIRSALRGEGAR